MVPPPLTSKSYAAIDVFKFIAALLVVAIHTRPLAGLGEWDYYLSCLCRIAVPFFFVFSSFIFYKKGKRIEEYVKRILILYLCWFIIELPWTINNFFIVPDKPFYKNLLIFLRGLFINSTFPASWFLTASWQGMLVIWLLSRKMGWRGLFALGILGYLSSLPGSMYNGLIDGTRFERIYWYGYNIILCPSNSFITAIPFVVMGKWLAEHSWPLSKGWTALLFVLSLVLGKVEVCFCKELYYINDTFITLLIATPLLVVLLLGCQWNVSGGICRFLRHTSILIYLLHLPLFYMIRNHAGIGFGPKGFLITALASILIASLIVSFSKRIPLLRYLY